MEKIQEEVITYLKAILEPLVQRGIQFACDTSEEGISIAIIPKNERDYRVLIGPKGEICIAVRRLIRVWVKFHCPHVNIHVFVPHSGMIK